MNKLKKAYNWFGSKNAIAAFLVLFIFASVIYSEKNFLSAYSISNLFRKAASDGGFLALGMTFVILIGQIDLSVGAVLALSGVVMAKFAGVNPALAIVLGLAAGTFCGLLNGLMVAKMRISSWIATLAMMLGVRGIVLLITKQAAISVQLGPITDFCDTKFLGFSILVWLLLVATFLCMHISHNTRLGLSFYAVGGNEEAARMMGLKVERTKILAYVFCGLLAAVAGILLAGSSYSAQPVAGTSWETTAIAMCALGGVKLSGGEGKFSGAFFGILIITIINTIFNYAGNLNSAWQDVIMGALVLSSIGFQSDLFEEMRTKRKTIAATKKA